MLVRTFLARFFENEITAGSGDLRTALFWLIALLAMPGAIMPALLGLASLPGPPGPPDPSLWGWAMVAKYVGVEALRTVSRGDKTLYLGFAMAVAALFSAITWSSLLVDRRDGLVLGVLPVGPSRIIGAKLIAIAAYVGLISVATHALASVSYGAFLAANNTVGFALRGMLAHFVASSAASAFVCLAVVAVQGLTLAAAGPRLFNRVSPVLQAVLVACVVLGFVALPGISGSVVDTLRQSGPHAHPWILRTPPLWFLGLYEWVLGTGDVTLRGLAATAGMSLAAVVIVTAITFPIAARRLLVDAVEHAGGFGRVGRSAILARFVTRLSGRQPEVRAVSQHYLATIARVGNHRFVIAIAIGAALAWSLPSWLSLASALPPEPRVDLLSLPMASMLFALVGLRVAASLPSDLGAARMFEVYPPAPEDIRQALERTMFALVVVPVTVLSVAGYWYLWGVSIALTHAACVLATGAALTAIALWRFDAMPCAAPWAPPSGHLRKWWPAYLVGFGAVTRGVPTVELLVLRWPLLTWLFVPYMIGLARLARAHSMTPRPAADGESALLLTTALRAGRGEGLHENAGDVVSRPSRRGLQKLPRPLFEYFRTPEGEERWFEGFSVWPGEIWRDVRLGLRRLIRAPGFTAFSVITLALGIGVTTAAYTAIYDYVWRPLGIARSEQVVLLSRNVWPRQTASISFPDYRDVAEQQAVFASLTAWSSVYSALAGNGTAELVTGHAVSGEYFQVFGVSPAIGRLIQPADDLPGAPAVVVVSNATWRKQLGADPEIVGKTVKLADRVFEVVGVSPASFRGPQIGQQLSFWVPLSASASLTAWLGRRVDAANRDADWLTIAGRLRPDVSVDAAGSRLTAIGKQLDVAAPLRPWGDARQTAGTRPRRWYLTALFNLGDVTAASRIGQLIVALPVLVLLVACTNIANLLLSRGASRRHEFAVRRALGASRWGMIRELVIEVGAIAAIGGAGGLLVTRALLTYLMATIERTFGYKPGFQIDPHFEPAVFIAAAVIVCLALVVAGLVPALRLTRGHSVRNALASDTAAGALPRWRGRGNLIALQVAVSVGLFLIAATLFRQIGLERRDAGPDLDRVALASIPFTEQQRDATRVRETVDRILADARTTPGVTDVSASTMYQSRAATSVQLTPPDRPFIPKIEEGRSADFIVATPGVFKTLALPIRSGRTFDDRDVAGAPAVVVMTESLARAMFGTADAGGRRMLMRFAHVRNGLIDAATLPLETVTIAGVVPDLEPQTPGRIRGSVFAPLAQRDAFDVNILARASTTDVMSAGSALRAAIRRVDPELAVSFAGRADVMLGGPAAALGLATTIMGALATLALVLSMVGLYGVLSHVMARRMREMGLRVALGAERRHIMRLVFTDGLRPVVQGLCIGLGAAIALRGVLQTTVSTTLGSVDPIAVILAILPLVVAGAVACYLPARRAASVDPNTALRDL